MVVTSTLTATTCVGCGISFAVPGDWLDARRKDGKNLWCPNGHSLSYSETEADRLRRQLATAEGNRRAAEERVERERRSHAATKGKLTKATKRATHGVCAAGCNRSFANVAAHMKTKHPDAVAEAGT